jgi:hypothetical protein
MRSLLGVVTREKIRSEDIRRQLAVVILSNKLKKTKEDGRNM